LESQSVQKNLKEIAKARGKRERFLVTRMWFSTFMSLLFPDRVKIPENIGNNVFIGNNQLVTRNNLSQYIIIKEISTEAPIALFSKLIKSVKTNVNGVTIDIIIKNKKMPIDLKDGGLRNRVAQWYRTIENPKVSDRIKKRAARLIYSYDVAASGETMYQSRIVVIVRAADGLKLKQGMHATEGFLSSYGIKYKVVKSKLDTVISYFSLLSSKPDAKIKDIPYTVQSPVTSAELLPTTQGYNDLSGTALGVNRYNRSIYMNNFKKTAAAKNILVVAPSGKGKTYMGISWMVDFFATNWNISSMDIKGNEISAFTKATGGLSIPLRTDSKKFINTLVLRKNQLSIDPLVYYSDRFKLSVDLMKTVVNPTKEQAPSIDTLVTSFLTSLYIVRGVLPENVNTWEESEGLHPHMLAEAFRRYASKSIRDMYGDLVDKVQERFNIYFSKEGAKSFMFLEEYNFDDIYSAKVVTYDFGMLDSSGVVDEVSFAIRRMFMRVINNEYSRNNKMKGEWTVKFLEEGQVEIEGLMTEYAKEFSLRRAQNQVTVLLTNSINAIKDNPEARPIIDNTNMLVIGAVSETSRAYLMKEFSLEEHEETLIKLLKDPQYENTFLLVNRMTSTSTTALIKIYNPDDVSRGVFFKGVDVE